MSTVEKKPRTKKQPKPEAAESYAPTDPRQTIAVEFKECAKCFKQFDPKLPECPECAKAATPEAKAEEQSSYTRAEQQHYHEIVQRTSRVQELRKVAVEKRRIAKDARDEADAAADELHTFIKQGPDLQTKLPFDQAKANGKPKADVKADEPAKPGVTRDVIESRPLDAVGIFGGLLTALHAQGIRTIGGLGQFTRDGGRLEDVKGIGEKGAEKIRAKLEEFWAANPLADHVATRTAEAAAAGPQRPQSWPVGKVPAKLSLSKDFREKFGFAGDEWRDVVSIDSQFRLSVNDDAGNAVMVLDADYVVEAWRDEEGAAT